MPMRNLSRHLSAKVLQNTSIVLTILMCISLSSETFAKTYQRSKSTLLLNQTTYKQVGETKLKFLFWDVYESRLFSADGTYKAKDSFNDEYPLVLEIEYLRDIDAKDLVENTIEQWQHLKLEQDQYEEYLPWLQQVWPNVKKGDRLAIYVDSTSSQFFFNGQSIDRVQSENFGQLFLSIWLSPNTSQPKLRKELINSRD